MSYRDIMLKLCPDGICKCGCNLKKKTILSKYPIYKKNLDNPNISRMYSVKLSTYLLNGVYDKIMEMNDEEYILCVGYIEKKGGDFQIGLTGSAKFNEDIDETAKRETCEEMGLVFEDFLKISSDQGKKHTSYVFTVNANNCKNFITSPFSRKKDDRRRKVTVLIHGDINTIFNIMRSIPVKSSNEEGIGYHVALKISEAKKMCRSIKSLKERFINWKINKSNF